MSARQPNLFEFDQNIFETNSTSAYESDEVNQGNKNLDELLQGIKKFIDLGILFPSDYYYNIAYYRKEKIYQDNQGLYCLDFAISSDSERLLSAFEKNPAITSKELLGVGIANGAVKTIQRYIDENPQITAKEILTKFGIFDRPTYWTYAKSDSIDDINCVKELLIEFASLRDSLNLTDKKFNFMRVNKRTKLEDQTAVIPRCFDGLCLESNIMKILQGVKNGKEN
jgi:hypothetical protein